MAIDPPAMFRMIGRVFGLPEITALTAPVSSRPARPTITVTGIRSASGAKEHGSQRQKEARGERHGRRERGMPRSRQLVLMDAVLGAQMSSQRVVSAQLLHDRPRRRLGQPLATIDLDQFLELLARGLGEVVALLGNNGFLGVALAGDRHVLAHGHRRGSRQQAGDTREHDLGQGRRVGHGYADGDSRPGNHAVVRSEDGGPEPVQLGSQPPEADDIAGLLRFGQRAGLLVGGARVLVGHGPVSSGLADK